jgi:beta-lactamase class A
MNNRRGPSLLIFGAVAVIALGVIITGLQLVRYSRIRTNFPPGLLIAGVPVGGLDQSQAAERLAQAYGVPVELRYGDAIIQVKPSLVGFELDLETMLAAADLQRINQPFWTAFWDYLWNHLPTPDEVPLRAKFNADRLRTYLVEDVATRYDQPPTNSMPVPGTVDFSVGTEGTVLDVERAVILVEDALRSPTSRVVSLTYNRVSPGRPVFQNLEVLLKNIIDTNEFDGLTEVYLLDLQTYQEIHFAYQNGEAIKPDIAFTAASTMKIPIMISTLIRTEDPTPPDIKSALDLMIELSENDPADRLMEQVLDPNLGPLMVTDDLQALGLENTFLAGYFYFGAPLLQRFSTPANSRSDVDTGPDPYNQTTPADMGMLLEDIYQCATTGGGTLVAVFPGKITQNECQEMIQVLSANEIPVLIKAGLPEGTQIAHKHGWITESDGYLHTMGNSGIVYTPGGNYILSIFVHHPVQLLWDPANYMIVQLSQAVYNYFNLNTQ